jgi:hypothetical protein
MSPKSRPTRCPTGDSIRLHEAIDRAPAESVKTDAASVASARMRHLITDLLEFMTRRLGGGLPLKRRCPLAAAEHPRTVQRQRSLRHAFASHTQHAGGRSGVAGTPFVRPWP